MKLAFIDLDGVIADNIERFKKAEEAKQAHEKEIELTGMTEAQIQRECTNLYWQTAFMPELVALDTLIEGADEAVEEIEKIYQVIYLTSRPESMRLSTYEWLVKVHLDGPKIVMKVSAFVQGYVKTVPWKAGIIQTIAGLFRASEVLFIDDEQANRDALMNAVLGEDSFELIMASSLAEAVEKLKEQED